MTALSPALRLVRCQRKAVTVVEPRAAGALLSALAEGQFLRRAKAAVGVSALDQACGEHPVSIQPLGLKIWALIPVQTKPAHPLEDAVHHFLRGTGQIGILDAQDKLPADVTGKQPVEQRRAGSADMEIAGRTGSKAYANVWFHEISNLAENIKIIRPKR